MRLKLAGVRCGLRHFFFSFSVANAIFKYQKKKKKKQSCYCCFSCSCYNIYIGCLLLQPMFVWLPVCHKVRVQVPNNRYVVCINRPVLVLEYVKCWMKWFSYVRNTLARPKRSKTLKICNFFTNLYVFFVLWNVRVVPFIFLRSMFLFKVQTF